MKQRCGLAWLMVGFACLAVLAITLTARFLPETRRLPLEESIAIFERKAGPNRIDSLSQSAVHDAREQGHHRRHTWAPRASGSSGAEPSLILASARASSASTSSSTPLLPTRLLSSGCAYPALHLTVRRRWFRDWKRCHAMPHWSWFRSLL